MASANRPGADQSAIWVACARIAAIRAARCAVTSSRTVIDSSGTLGSSSGAGSRNGSPGAAGQRGQPGVQRGAADHGAAQPGRHPAPARRR